MALKHVEDPSIAATAEAEYREMWSAVINRVRHGESFWIARDRIAAERGPDITRKYGKETAKRALAGLMSHGPGDMPKHVRDWRSNDLLDQLEQLTWECDGAVVRFSNWQRWCFQTFGFAGFTGKPEIIRPRLWGEELEAFRAERSQERANEAHDRRVAEEKAEAERRHQKEEQRKTRDLLQRLARNAEKDAKAREKQERDRATLEQIAANGGPLKRSDHEGIEKARREYEAAIRRETGSNVVWR
jgi:flagellar biosynthesis GTPase FlhF